MPQVHPDAEWRAAAGSAFAALASLMERLNTDTQLYQALSTIVGDAALMSSLTEEQRRVARLLKRDMETHGIGLWFVFCVLCCRVVPRLFVWVCFVSSVGSRSIALLGVAGAHSVALGPGALAAGACRCLFSLRVVQRLNSVCHCERDDSSMSKLLRRRMILLTFPVSQMAPFASPFDVCARSFGFSTSVHS